MDAAPVITQITVAGMTCEHCSKAVRAELSGVTDVTDVTIDLAPHGETPVTITSEAPLDPAAIEAAVTEAGYALV